MPMEPQGNRLKKAFSPKRGLVFAVNGASAPPPPPPAPRPPAPFAEAPFAAKTSPLFGENAFKVLLMGISLSECGWERFRVGHILFTHENTRHSSSTELVGVWRDMVNTFSVHGALRCDCGVLVPSRLAAPMAILKRCCTECTEIAIFHDCDCEYQVSP